MTFDEFNQEFIKLPNYYFERNFLTPKLFNIVNKNHKEIRCILGDKSVSLEIELLSQEETDELRDKILEDYSYKCYKSNISCKPISHLLDRDKYFLLKDQIQVGKNFINLNKFLRVELEKYLNNNKNLSPYEHAQICRILNFRLSDNLHRIKLIKEQYIQNYGKFNVEIKTDIESFIRLGDYDVDNISCFRYTASKNTNKYKLMQIPNSFVLLISNSKNYGKARCWGQYKKSDNIIFYSNFYRKGDLTVETTNRILKKVSEFLTNKDEKDLIHKKFPIIRSRSVYINGDGFISGIDEKIINNYKLVMPKNSVKITR